tara:strand:+ start:421 stop:648 length:228 start_codon:yes stop_codon:yes gene_type:complete
MQSKQIEECKEQTKTLFKVVDKLEQRITTLEKVIGKLQLRVADIVYWIDNKLERKKDDLKDMPEEVLVKTWEEKR